MTLHLADVTRHLRAADIQIAEVVNERDDGVQLDVIGEVSDVHARVVGALGHPPLGWSVSTQQVSDTHVSVIVRRAVAEPDAAAPPAGEDSAEACRLYPIATTDAPLIATGYRVARRLHDRGEPGYAEVVAGHVEILAESFTGPGAPGLSSVDALLNRCHTVADSCTALARALGDAGMLTDRELTARRR